MATQAVLKYLKETNRPYSANDIVQNMHKEYSKTQVQKGLDELVSEGSIFEKVYGKQKVYCIKQEEVVDDNDNELAEITDKINIKTQSLANIVTELRTVESTIKILLAEPTTDEAKGEISNLTSSNQKLIEKLEILKMSADLIPQKEKELVFNKRATSLKEYKTRKRICTNIINEILESYPKSKKALFEEIGIDEDGDAVLDAMQP